MPSLYAPIQLAGLNSWFDSKIGKPNCVPEGQVGNIKWPYGIRTSQCARTLSGHWLLGVGGWVKVSLAEVKRAMQLTQETPVA